SLWHELGEVHTVEIALEVDHRVPSLDDGGDQGGRDGPSTRTCHPLDLVARLIERQHRSDQSDSFDATAFEREVAPQLWRTGRCSSVLRLPRVELEQPFGCSIESALK